MIGDYLAYFNIPPVDNGEDLTVQNKLLDYIKGATPGSEIRGHITRISKLEITQALIDAHTRGVKVYLVQNGACMKDESGNESFARPCGNELHKSLGPKRHRYGYAKQRCVTRKLGLKVK